MIDDKKDKMCECGHELAKHRLLERFQDGSPIPSTHEKCGIGNCECPKFILASDADSR